MKHLLRLKASKPASLVKHASTTPHACCNCTEVLQAPSWEVGSARLKFFYPSMQFFYHLSFTGPFGTKPVRASTFNSVTILMDTEALSGFAMPARTSAFSSV